MSICATRAHYQPQNLAENDIKLSNFCQKATKAPEDVKRIEIDRTDRCKKYVRKKTVFCIIAIRLPFGSLSPLRPLLFNNVLSSLFHIAQ